MRTVVLSLIAVLLLGQPVAGADDSVRVIDEHSGVDPAAFPDIAAQAAREYEKLKAMFGTDVGVVTVKPAVSETDSLGLVRPAVALTW